MNERIAVVTGSNRGIGKAIAEGLSAAGLRVLATTRAELDVASDASIEAFARALGSRLDVTDSTPTSRAARST